MTKTPPSTDAPFRAESEHVSLEEEDGGLKINIKRPAASDHIWQAELDELLDRYIAEVKRRRRP